MNTALGGGCVEGTPHNKNPPAARVSGCLILATRERHNWLRIDVNHCELVRGEIPAKRPYRSRSAGRERAERSSTSTTTSESLARSPIWARLFSDAATICAQITV
jgi:hypothetical protein